MHEAKRALPQNKAHNTQKSVHTHTHTHHIYTYSYADHSKNNFRKINIQVTLKLM